MSGRCDGAALYGRRFLIICNSIQYITVSLTSSPTPLSAQRSCRIAFSLLLTPTSSTRSLSTLLRSPCISNTRRTPVTTPPGSPPLRTTNLWSLPAWNIQRARSLSSSLRMARVPCRKPFPVAAATLAPFLRQRRSSSLPMYVSLPHDPR